MGGLSVCSVYKGSGLTDRLNERMPNSGRFKARGSEFAHLGCECDRWGGINVVDLFNLVISEARTPKKVGYPCCKQLEVLYCHWRTLVRAFNMLNFKH